MRVLMPRRRAEASGVSRQNVSPYCYLDART